MKYHEKQDFFLAVIFICTFLSNCSKEKMEPDNSNSEVMDRDLQLIGDCHNDALDFVFSEFHASPLASKLSKKKSANGILNDEEMLEMLRFLDDKSKT
jgi:hypothetical protein